MLLDASAPAPEAPPAPRNDRTDVKPGRRDDAPANNDRPSQAAAPSKDDKPVSDSKRTNDGNDAKDCSEAKDTPKEATATADKDSDAKQAATVAVDSAAAEVTTAVSTEQANQQPAATVQPTVGTPQQAAEIVAASTEVAPEAVLAAAAPQAAASADAAANAQAGAQTNATPDAKTDTKAAGKPASLHGDTQANATPAQARVEPAKDNGANSTADDHAAKQHHGAEAQTSTANTEPHGRGPDVTAAVRSAADAVQNLGLVTSQNHAAAQAHTNTAALATQGAAVPVSNLAVEIAAQAHAGKNRFEIRLDPPELGRIDVRLDVDRDGNVTSRLVVDRAETLDLLRRDSSQLERALQQAGLKTGDNALEFSLRGHGFGRDESNSGSQQGARLDLSDDNSAPIEAMRNGYGRHLGLGGGIDIRV